MVRFQVESLFCGHEWIIPSTCLYLENEKKRNFKNENKNEKKIQKPEHAFKRLFVTKKTQCDFYNVCSEDQTIVNDPN